MTPTTLRFAETLCENIFKGRVPTFSELPRLLCACDVVFGWDNFPEDIRARLHRALLESFHTLMLRSGEYGVN